MSKIAKIIAVFAAVTTMALAASAFTAPKAQAYLVYPRAAYYPYAPFGTAYYPYAPFGGAFASPLYNPISQWIVLGGLFNPFILR